MVRRVRGHKGLIPVSPDIREKVISRLEQLERERGVTVLFAVESGSRAWGFASEDSDYDVRFVYSSPLKSYLTLAPAADTITTPPDEAKIEFHGWDLRKACHLLRKSNPSLLEWTVSPIVYLDRKNSKGQFLRMGEATFDKHTLMEHYLHLASDFVGRYTAERSEVSLKKYFYILRSLFSLMWVDRMGTIPPVEFEVLLNTFIDTGTSLEKRVRELLAMKRSGSLEDREYPACPLLEEYIQTLLLHYKTISKSEVSAADNAEEIDAFFFAMYLLNASPSDAWLSLARRGSR